MDEALIIGGGPAGASMAIRLAGAGWPVRLIEREVGPHDKVCGEFLSYEAADYLEELGVDAVALGAVTIGGVELVRGRHSARAGLPFEALSLSRRIMDEALLHRAAEAGAQIERGRRVTRLQRRSGGWNALLDDGTERDSACVVLATGKHDLREWRRPPGPQSDLIGFKQHWALSPAQGEALRGRVELHLFDGGYAGLEAVEGGRANLCLVVRRRAFQAAGQAWPHLLERIVAACPGLAGRLDGGRPSTRRPLAIAAIPYGHVRRRSDGLWRLGDQAAVIPSFAGEGMSIALHSAKLAAETWLAGGDVDTYQRALAGDVGRQVGRATWLSRALVRPWGQAAILAAIRSRPSILATAAALTRIPPRALRMQTAPKPLRRPGALEQRTSPHVAPG